MKIIDCPHCGTRYRLDPPKFQRPQLRIRCKRCGNVFEADLSSAPDAPAAPTPAAASPPSPAAPNSPKPAPAAPAAESRGHGELVLVAHEDAAVRADIVSALADAGFQTLEADNGIEALAIIQRQRPDVAVLDVTLPKVFGFEVCEIVRRDADLADVRLLLIAAIYDQSRYKRPPQQLYGADDYIEKHQLKGGIVGKVAALASSAGGDVFERPIPAPIPGAGAKAAPAPAPAPAAATQPATATENRAPTAAELGITDADFVKIRRLARTIVSDIVLYNQEKVETGVRSGDLAGALAAELEEGKQLFAERLGQLAVDPAPFMLEYLAELEVSKRREYGLEE